MKKALFLIFVLACLYCRANAMTERIWWTGSAWGDAQHVNIANYNAMARDHRAFNPTLAAFGSRQDGSGLVKVVSDNGGSSWHEMLVSYNDYKALAGAPFRSAADPNLYTCVFAIRADNDVVQWVRYVGQTQTWLVTNIEVSGEPLVDYKALAFDSTSNVGSGSFTFYGTRTDGSGVDQIYSSNYGSTWSINLLITSVNYKAMSSMMHNGFSGARADGTGLERVWWANSQWNVQLISDQDFVALAEDINSTGPAYGVFVARADGSGVKRVFSTNGTTWTTSAVGDEHYKALAALGHLSNNMIIGSYNCDKSIFDLNNNCIVDLEDFADFAAEWLDCAKELPGDCN